MSTDVTNIRLDKVYCEYNARSYESQIKTQKFLLYCICVIATFLLTLYFFIQEPFFIFISIGLYVGSVIPILITKMIKHFDEKRVEKVRKEFELKGISLKAKVKKEDYRYLFEFDYSGRIHQIQVPLVDTVIKHGPVVYEFADRASDYLRIALQKEESLNIIYNPHSKEVFLVGTESLNIAEFIREQNKKSQP